MKQVKRADFEDVKGFPMEDRIIDVHGMRNRYPFAPFWSKPDFVEKMTGKHIQVKGVNSSFSSCGITDDLKQATLKYFRLEKSNFFIFDVSSVSGKNLVKRHVLIPKKSLVELVKDGYVVDLFRYVDSTGERIRPQIGPNKRNLLMRYGGKIFKS